MSYKWPGIPNGDYSFDHGRAVWNKIINYLRRLSEKLDADIVDATADRRGMMTAADKDKLDGVEPGAEVNQNAFSGVKVGSSTIEADAKTDVLELVAGTNISLTVDTTNDKVTITNTYEHPTYTARTGKPTQDLTPGFGDTVTISQIVSDGTGHVTAANDKTITIPSTEASQSVAGLMSTTDKTKLDGIATGAEVNQNAFSNIQVGPATVAADSKTDTLTLGPGAGVIISANTTNDSITIGCVEATQSVPGIMSTADKTKLDGISAGAEVNQNTFAIVKVGSTNVTADAKQDTLTLIEGSNVTLSPNATNDSITISATDTVYTHPVTSGNKHVPSGGTSLDSLIWSADGTAAWGYPKRVETTSVTGNASRSVFIAADGDINRVCYNNNFQYNPATDNLTVGKINGFTLGKSVPSDAVFTDTVYTIGTASGSGNAITSLSISGSTITPTLGKTFSESGHTHAYLPLAGGTLTGNLLLDALADVYRTIDNGGLTLNGGTAFGKGAGLILHGKQHVDNPGQFWLCAMDGASRTDLRGTPSGELSWNNNPVVTTKAIQVNTNSGYITFSNNTQIVWGNVMAETSGTAVTFARAFASGSTPRIVFGLTPAAVHTNVNIPIAYPISATGMTVYVNTSTGHLRAGCSYVAIGKGA